ncbi:unnamed protein product [Pleuronectes platessa]|uniref:Uncharacterized protein n=1 Tax=Pleuronectes platessa TaxID=8262 RepID=A0A9N7TS44_PLEPL|nr:unnamed protein product [Pleuronectes platessa]
MEAAGRRRTAHLEETRSKYRNALQKAKRAARSQTRSKKANAQQEAKRAARRQTRSKKPNAQQEEATTQRKCFQGTAKSDGHCCHKNVQYTIDIRFHTGFGHPRLFGPSAVAVQASDTETCTQGILLRAAYVIDCTRPPEAT